jgi:hypothetical protein
MKYLLIFLFFLTLNQEFTPVFELDAHVDLMYRDNLDNLYTVDEYTLKKYDSKGKLLFTYSDNFLGKISSVSIGEGLKVMVYYQNNAQMVVLDNSLSQLAPPVALNFYNLGSVSLVCSSSQNRYWLYDPLQGSLIRTTNTFTQEFNSGNLDQILNLSLNPTLMTEWGNTLYLNDPKEGILVFDIFGTYKKTIPLKGLKAFQVSEYGIYYVENGEFKFYDFKSFLIQTVQIPEMKATNALISNKMLFIKTEKGISVFNRNTF